MKSNSSNLNKEQQQAANHKKGPALVIAGAGSGKTHTIVYRVANLIKNNVDPKNILLLTFTNKAANEMLHRTKNILKSKGIKGRSNIIASTFHSFAFLTIKKNSKLFKRAKYKLDTELDLFKRSIKSVRKKSKLKFKSSDHSIISIYNLSINRMESIKNVIDSIKDKDLEEEYKFIRQCVDQYELDKEELEYIDFNDILLDFYLLLKTNSEFRKKLQQQHKYIIVDEYQDTNILQDKIVFLLSGASKNIMVVGDDLQSIYGFNGAHYKNILTFTKRIGNDAKEIYIQQNYRSTQQILDLANAVVNIKENPGFHKTLFSNMTGDLPEVVKYYNNVSEASSIAEELEDIIKQNDYKYLKNISVLFRSSYHSMALELELTGRNIPFKKFGGQGYLERSHIRDAIALMCCAYRNNDLISWVRCLELLPGIGEKKANQLASSVQYSKKKIIIEKYQPKSNQYIDKLVNLVNDLHLNTSSSKMDTIIDFFEEVAEFSYKEETIQKRLNDLKMFKNIIEKFPNLKDFCHYITSPDYDKVKDEEGNYVTLSTIHSAKGLEWKKVYIIGACDDQFPSVRASTPEEQLEELRLMYVAITRAKKYLNISYYVNKRNNIGTLSRFIQRCSSKCKLIDKSTYSGVVQDLHDWRNQESNYYEEN